MNKVDVVIIDDESYIPVPKFVTDWIIKNPKELDVYEDVPDNIMNFLSSDKIKKFEKIMGHKFKAEVYVSSGSWENDRALFISGVAPHIFATIKELNTYLNKNGMEIGAEFPYLAY